MIPRETPSTDMRAPGTTHRAASVLLVLASLFALGGCQVVKGIFEVGFGLGVVLVVAFVAIVGGVIAMVARK